MRVPRRPTETDERIVVRPWRVTVDQAEREDKVDRLLKKTRDVAIYEIARDAEYKVDPSYKKEYAGIADEVLRILPSTDSRHGELEIRLEVKAGEEIVYYSKVGETRYAKVRAKALNKIR